MNKNENLNCKPMILLSAMFMGIVGSGFMSKEDLPVQNVPSIVQQKEKMKLFVDAPVTMKAGDTSAINKIVNTVMKDQIPAMSTATLKSSQGLTSVYQLGDFEITLENFDLKKSSDQEVLVSIRKVDAGTTVMPESLVLTTVNDQSDAKNLKGDVVTTYKLKVSVSDDVKPVISLVQDEDTITEGDDFDLEAYIDNATDDVDGVLEHTTTSDVDSETAGTYTITYSAKDKAGNEASASVNITVEEKEEIVVVNDYSYASSAAGSTSNMSVSGSAVANSALGQLGVYQDCTSLVSNALAAAGIYYQGYPAGYMSLGTIVSANEAVPGDILYYANGGAGSAHVAIYIGNGQAVHGGWNGNQTVQASAYVGTGPVFIHIGQ